MKKTLIGLLLLLSVSAFGAGTPLVIEYPLHTPIKIMFECQDFECNEIKFTQKTHPAKTVEKIILKSRVDSEIQSLFKAIVNEKEHIIAYNAGENQQAYNKTNLKKNEKQLQDLMALLRKLEEGKKKSNVSTDSFHYLLNFFSSL